ncbi:2-polyprenyl-6-methoxyphenol hydroxylase [Streptomyces sp. 2224.1]|nr:FAD-dependent monooxygenase [Streptomyces sp. 2224.1]SED78014.1 2-polyprenyl-6-methoxyphenol hydroxylase [Streptomyces sp. 2224.1]
MSVEVIVAGGGPVGLLTAALLDAAGITVEVLERRTGRSEQARATTMHPRTLEVLTLLRTEDDRRLSDILVSLGRPEPKAHFAVLPDLLDYAQLDTPYPFVLMVPQTTTERVLAAHLRRRGIAVHYGHDVSGFAQDADGVEVTVNGGVRRAGYLVGADGAHSLVRRHAGIDFPGTPPSMVGFVADVTLTDSPDGAAHHWDHRHGQLSFLPFPEGAYGLSDGSAYRVFGTEAADTRLTSDEVRARQARSLTLDELRAILRRMTGSDHGLRDGLWLSTANDTTRHAVKYRANRVFLAGDAAHVHLPAGGQGLNVGLQDAAPGCPDSACPTPLLSPGTHWTAAAPPTSSCRTAPCTAGWRSTGSCSPTSLRTPSSRRFARPGSRWRRPSRGRGCPPRWSARTAISPAPGPPPASRRWPPRSGPGRRLRLRLRI